MDKRVILERLKEHLQAELEATRRASADAAAYAVDSEAKAREKWDTQGLEASYLAAGQAGHAKELAAALQRLQSESGSLAAPSSVATLGALVATTFEGETDWYFLAPVGGGEEIEVDGTRVTIITPGSPLFAQLRGKARGQSVPLPSGAALRVEAVS